MLFLTQEYRFGSPICFVMYFLYLYIKFVESLGNLQKPEVSEYVWRFLTVYFPLKRSRLFNIVLLSTGEHTWRRSRRHGRRGWGWGGKSVTSGSITAGQITRNQLARVAQETFVVTQVGPTQITSRVKHASFLNKPSCQARLCVSHVDRATTCLAKLANLQLLVALAFRQRWALVTRKTLGLWYS